MKNVLMVAYAFPPFRNVGHSIRVIKFIKYLPGFGWSPTVLTVDDQREYETMRKVGSSSLLSEIRQDTKIIRTSAGEPSLRYLAKETEFAQRNHLTKAIAKVVGGSRRWAYRNVAVPDRCVTWLPYAVKRGHEIIRSEDIDVIFATCPPHSATLVGAALKLLTGKPLILDYRDDWIDTPWYRAKPSARRTLERRMERWAVRTADRVILVTERSRNAFVRRYPAESNDKFVLIPNGVDLGDFAALSSGAAASRDDRFTIVHAGSLNESASWGRSVAGLFEAIRDILQQQPGLAPKLSLVFAGDLPEGYRRLAAEMGLSGVIKSVGHLPHDEVLSLIGSADLLLAINYDGWSTIIPGKIYEYWAVGGPPILLLSCPGAASDLIEQHQLGFCVDAEDVGSIERAILTTYDRGQTGNPIRICTRGIEAFDRKSLSCDLARLLSQIG